MILRDTQVKHKAFGEGVVVAISGKYFTVKFSSTEKTFVYPDIFEKFLTLADGTISDKIISDIQIAKAEKQEIADKKNEENLRAMTKGIVIPGKENVGTESDDEEYRTKNESEEI